MFVVDDHQLFRAGIIELLRDQKGIEVVGVASDASDLWKRIEDRLPDVVLMDIDFGPGRSQEGIVVTQQIKEKLGASINIIMLTMHDDAKLKRMALRAGACAYVLKSDDPGRLTHAIQNAADRKMVQ